MIKEWMMYMEVLTIEQQQEYFQMAQQMEYEGDYESAGELYSLVMTSAFETQDYPFYIETALRAMSIDMNMRNYDEAYILTEVLKDHIEEHGSREQYIIFENIRLSVRHNLNIEDATIHFERLLQQAYEIESFQQIFSVGNNLIYCYNSRGYYEDAIVLIESMKVYLEGLMASDDSIPIFMFWINFFLLYHFFAEYPSLKERSE
jgi:tetratricopeptide (TPR) repeat protein